MRKRALTQNPLSKCGDDGGSQPGRGEGSDVSEFGGVVTSVPFGTSAPDLQLMK